MSVRDPEASRPGCRQEPDDCPRDTHANGIAASIENNIIISDDDKEEEMSSSKGDHDHGTDASFMALLESLKGTNTSVHFLSNDGSSLPVMDVEAAQSCLMLFPDKTKEEKEKENTMDFTNLRLLCLTEIEKIQSSWLTSLTPKVGATEVHYPLNITLLITNTLKSYAGTAIRGRGLPPFVHPSQTTDCVSSHPLLECLTLVKGFNNPLSGLQESTESIIKNRISDIRTQYSEYDELGVLACFQACLIYALTLSLYVRGDDSKDAVAEAITTLHGMACHISKQGVVTWQEQHGTLPRWEQWIVGEARRRALFTMCLFDTMLALKDKLPTYLFFEIQSLPAPGPKCLWQAESRAHWTKEYTAYSIHWDNGAFLRLAELWPPPAAFTKVDRQHRHNRVDLWLEDVDEFGAMFYAIMTSVDIPGWGAPPV